MTKRFNWNFSFENIFLDLFIFISETFEHVWAMWICLGKLCAEATTLSQSNQSWGEPGAGAERSCHARRWSTLSWESGDRCVLIPAICPQSKNRGWTSRICVWRGAKCMWKLAAWVTKQVYVTGLCQLANTLYIRRWQFLSFNFGRAFVLVRSTSNKSRLQKVTWTSLWRSWWDKGQSKEATCGMRLVNIGHFVLSCLICLLFGSDSWNMLTLISIFKPY